MAKRKQQRGPSDTAAAEEVAVTPEERAAEPVETEGGAETPRQDVGGQGPLSWRHSQGGRILEWILILLVTVGFVYGMQAFLVKPYQIPSGSMEPTLDIGQRILVNRLSYRFGDPSVGDIAVFHPPVGADKPDPSEVVERASAYSDLVCGAARGEGEACSTPIEEKSDQAYIKRVVAGPGDTLSVRNGHPVVNGVEKKDEPYINPCGGQPECNLPKTIKIPPDHYFMMGDNRGGSFDSRFWGPVPRDWFVGKAFATYWPPDRLGLF